MARFYEELEHTADWTIRVWGENAAALFEHAAAAMFELQGTNLEAEPDATVAYAVRVNGADHEALLVAWLNELLFLSEVHDVLFSRFQVHIEAAPDDLLLTGQARGSPGRGPLAHIKAVTYWDLAVQQGADSWQATVTFDT
jgi:SHS2 domain-containing protein